jgi:protease-4
LPEIKDPLQEWLKELSGSARMWVLKQELGDAYPVYHQLKQIKQTRGVLARIPYDIMLD